MTDTQNVQADTETVDLDSAKQQMMALVMEQKFSEAVALGYQTYEKLVAAIKATSSTDSVKTKTVVEHVHNLDEFDDAEEIAANAVDVIKQQVFGVIQDNPLAAVALYELLGDYNSDAVKAYRDHVIANYKSEVAGENGDADDVVEDSVNVTKEELKKFRSNVESIWNLGGEPVPAKDGGFEVKKSKSGEKGLKFSRIPKSADNAESDATEKSVTTSRQVWYVDGERSPHKNLSGVAMWQLSDGLTTYTASDVYGIIEKRLGRKPSAGEEFDGVEVNGHTLARKTEKVN